MSHTLIAELSQIWGPGIAVAEPDADDLLLLPAEAGAVARAIPKRQHEFASGRSAARAALALLGHSAVAIPAGADRAPVWPKGIVGSITHTNDLCFAALSRQTTTRGIGVDAEQAAPLSDAVRARILNFDEENHFDALQATAVFCAKEAAYKALYPITGEVWGFDAMSIRLDPEHRAFQATLHRPAGPYSKGSSLTGVLLGSSSHFLTGICLNV